MTNKELKNEEGAGFALPRENYKFLAIGFIIIVFGFILMAGGKADSPNEFNEAVFSFRRITLAPIIVLLGFAFEVWAIMRKPKQS